MVVKRIFIAFVLILAFTLIASAGPYTSTSYILVNPKIVISGGNATSLSYSLRNVQMGNSVGGIAESSSYRLIEH